MEAKKNPAKDVYRKSGMFFQIGLGISIALVITAFEWRTEVANPKPRVVDYSTELVPLIPVTEIKDPEPPLPSPVKNNIIKPSMYSPIAEVPTEAITETSTIGIDPENLPSTPMVIASETTEVCDECVFFVVESPATPVGGLEGFYSTIRKNIKYPRRAQNIGMEGKVTVEFVINRDGTLVDFKVISGIGAGCDEEAMRVLALTKWNPGKQRGIPVRVKMVMPIHFRLN